MAIAYLLHKTPYVFPIIGGRKVEHLLANIEALELSLSDEQIQYLESIVPLDLGFPGTMIVSFCHRFTIFLFLKAASGHWFNDQQNVFGCRTHRQTALTACDSAKRKVIAHIPLTLVNFRVFFVYTNQRFYYHEPNHL